MKFAELMTDNGPVYSNADHAMYLQLAPHDKTKTYIHLTHPRPDDEGRIIVNHAPVDVVQRLYKGLE